LIILKASSHALEKGKLGTSRESHAMNDLSKHAHDQDFNLALKLTVATLGITLQVVAELEPMQA